MNLKSAARALGGEVRGNQIHCPGPGHSATDRSLSVVLDWRAPDGILVFSFAGDDIRTCRDFVRSRLGLAAWKPRSSGSSCATTDQREMGGKSFPTCLQVAQLAPIESRAQRALAFWNEARPLAGTVAEQYLINRVGREIDWPTDLRYLAQCPRKTNTGLERHPTLIALLRDIDTDRPHAIQRIFLKPDGSDRLRDAAGKMTLGPSAGTVCKLSPDADVTTGLGIVEGVEKGLALLAAGWSPIWATCGTSGLSGFPVLDGPELSIFADNDAPGLEAAAKCSQRWVDAGRHARVVAPKTPNFDWDDELKAAA